MMDRTSVVKMILSVFMAISIMSSFSMQDSLGMTHLQLSLANISQPFIQCAVEGGVACGAMPVTIHFPVCISLPSSNLTVSPALRPSSNAALATLNCIVMPGQPSDLIGSCASLVLSLARSIASILSLIHISEPTRQAEISYAVFC